MRASERERRRKRVDEGKKSRGKSSRMDGVTRGKSMQILRSARAVPAAAAGIYGIICMCI